MATRQTRLRGLRLTVTAAMAIAVAAVITPLLAQPAHAHQPPSNVTRSYYMGTADVSQAAQLGCNQQGRSGRMTLFFGAPVRFGTSGALNQQYGATLWGAANQTLNQIEEIVKWFVIGYAQCNSEADGLSLGIGTSNSGIDGDAWIREHGKAWSISVSNLHSWALANYPQDVAVYGAYDAEPSWASYSQTYQWMQGYTYDNPGRESLHYHGSADGCPQTTSENGACNNGWTQAGIWHLADEVPVSIAIPQIYATAGGNAAQWTMISRYGYRYHNGDSIGFAGVMTQHGACEQNGCPAGTGNTWDQARDQLLLTTNSSPYTQNTYAGGGMTDIRWFNGY
jgi:hypothetical protein